ncbi:MAG: hypothetical protein CVU00_00645 [Bacteroidetes bacterium HGW-Bacteroidetes-17]|jgi:hypothetical protein|nr:MAG: hypothetical protein CVU00_00645 [Bacteroidetes bacterium HGW-Bacteroidetes-17]
MKKSIKKALVQIVLSISFILIAVTTYGQRVMMEHRSFDDFLTNQEKSLLQRSILKVSDIEGSPYLDKTFVKGSVITRDSLQYQNVPLRYNIYNDEFEFKVNEEKYLVISEPSSILKISIEDAAFIYLKKDNKYGYYQLLNDDKIKLLLRYNVKFRQANVSNGINQARPPKFNRGSDTYYIQIGYNEPQQIKNKKDIDLIFGSKDNTIKELIKKERIDIRKESDLLKFVKLLNTSDLIK